MLTFKGDPSSADYLLDEAPETLRYMAHSAKPTIPVFVVRAMAAHPPTPGVCNQLQSLL
jgi:hypothetical protein